MLLQFAHIVVFGVVCLLGAMNQYGSEGPTGGSDDGPGGSVGVVAKGACTETVRSTRKESKTRAIRMPSKISEEQNQPSDA